MPRSSSSNAESSSVLKKEKDLVFKKDVDGAIIILVFGSDRYFRLDGIAAEVWTLIDGKRSINQIKQSLIKKHKPPIQRFEKDLTKLIQDLKKRRLIH